MELVSSQFSSVTDLTVVFSVADYKYDDERDYGNDIYSQAAGDGSQNWHSVEDHGKPKPYLSFIHS